MSRVSTILFRRVAFALLLAVVLLAVSLPVIAATAPRTFVASYGNDAQPCTLTQPCRGFFAAAERTAAGGEIIVLDSGGGAAITLRGLTITAAGGLK